MKDLPNLDLLRSIAVMLVVVAHLLLYLGHSNWIGWLGLTGVCIFFVHTSLVLMWSLERDPHIWRFYIRRIFRIYPLWLVVLFLTVALRIPMSPSVAPRFAYYAPTWHALVTHTLLIFNLFGGGSLVGASWTLPVEVDMYLVLPVLFAFARSFRSAWALLCIDAFVIVYAHRTLPPINSSLLMCIPYFLPGIMAYVLMKHRSLQRMPAWTFGVWVVILVAVNRVYGNYLVSSIFCLALGLSLPLFHQISWAPLKRVAMEIAKYSYGIYLTHIPSIVIAVYLMRHQPLALRAAACVVCFCGFPVLLYHLVELPMLRYGARLARRVEAGPSPRVDDKTILLEPVP
jgi:peptidoglycan/LPS O-acetylase OafA/YrhL